MANLSTKIKMYCDANGVSEVDFIKDVMLQDDSDGNGAYVKFWGLSIPEPTDVQLAEQETAANTEEALQTVLNNRANDYPSIKDQLDKIYHEGIDEWKKLIKVTKDKYPK